MKLYAIFDEYQSIWPTTIRRTREAALQALKEEPNMQDATDATLLNGGLCVGEFEHTALPVDVNEDCIKWVDGWRAGKRADADATCSTCRSTVAVRDGEEWEQGVDVCDSCAQTQAHAAKQLRPVLSQQVMALETRERGLTELLHEILATIQVNLQHGRLTVPAGRARFDEMIEVWRKRQLDIALPKT